MLRCYRRMVDILGVAPMAASADRQVTEELLAAIGDEHVSTEEDLKDD
jgi:hypothetical protein